MSDKFNEAELKGREKFKTFCDNQDWCTLVKFDENKYGAYDVAFLSGTTKMIGELKDREYKSTTFDSWICEKEKLERIQQKVKKRKDVKVMYINTFTDDKILFWDITNYAPKKYYKKVLPKNTAEDNGDKEKDIFYLATDKSIVNKTLFF
ncbi:MAG: hypothetical protein GY870_06635 [archaeon]|nr:hypothetical protein [archaeon]